MQLLRLSVGRLLFGAGIALAGVAPAQEGSHDIDVARILPDPMPRATNRTRFAPELGGWDIYTGQLHSHTRGHDKESSVIAWPLVQSMAWSYGYDFFSRNNHSTSWADYDANRPYLEEFMNAGGNGLVLINGQENYYDGGNWPPGSHDHPNHYNTINGWPRQGNGPLSVFYGNILVGHRADPQQSIHVQLNHVAQPSADHTLLPSDPTTRAMLRRIVDTAEIAFGGGSDEMHLGNFRTYLTLLRNGWRVSPTAHYDVHAERHDNANWGARRPDGSFVRPWVLLPGQPYEVVQRANGEQNFAPRGRTGMVVPASTPWSKSAFLTGLADRRTFRATMDRSVGMFAVNGRVMGDEFSVGDNRDPLKFKVWGKSFAQHDGTYATFSRAELWSPTRPDAPIKTVDLGNATNFGAELFSVTPYESVYVVRLVGAWPDNDIVMSPVWINNPRPKLGSAMFDAPSGTGTQLLKWNGGAKRVLIQRARVWSPNHPRNWETAREIDNVNFYWHDISYEPVYTYWRVVDANDTSIMSNEVLFSRPNRSPVGSFDELNVTAGKVRGWTFDPDHSTSPVTVHVYSGSTFVASGVTGLARPDVQQAHGTGAYSGYDIQLPAAYLTPGQRSFTVYALDLDAEPNPALGGSPRWGSFGEVEEPIDPCDSKPSLPQCQ